ncbi:TonB-dependent receptor [Ereboglobus luteus]|uniref:TonB-dependent receptor n=1 Tax=Ereboglobus luteus TaxID=1796921 RepID=A0A2U8E617_9BACT|nr:TonB-dependent receptor [Ereboglobus luteus]AWI10276.1 hypothetical protein CKA38_14355 [Ereboglobus luteus]
MNNIPRNPRSGFFPKGLILSALIAICLFPAALFAQQPTGSIKGHVVNDVTKQVLNAATVTINDTRQSVLTDSQGLYVLPNLKSGIYTITVEYPGMDNVTRTVSVSDKEVLLDIMMSSEIYVLDKFTVGGEREGNAAAIAAQRSADNLQLVLTADAFGNITKGNIGNMLRRIPGITGTTDEVDTESIQLRGMSANFTSLDIDGVRSTSGGEGRTQSTADIPADMIETVTVVKSPTPDMPSDSLAGRIMMTTKSAYDRQGRQINIRAANSYNFTYGRDVGAKRHSSLSPAFSLSYSDVFSVGKGRNNLGIYARASWERVLAVRGTTSWDTSSTSGTRTDEADGSTYKVRQQRFQNASTALHGNDRSGASIKVDYKLNPKVSLGGSISYSNASNDMYRVRNILSSGGSVDHTLSHADMNTWLINPDNGEKIVYGDYAVVEGANYSVEQSFRDQTTERYSAQLYGTYRDDSSGIKIDTRLSVQRSERESRERKVTIRSNKKINYAMDRRAEGGNDRWPAIRVLKDFYSGNTEGVVAGAEYDFIDANPFADDFSEVYASNAEVSEYYLYEDPVTGEKSIKSRVIASYEASSNNLEWQRKYTQNDRVDAKVDLTKKISWKWPIEFKTGAAFSYETNETWRHDLRGKILLEPFNSDLSSLLDTSWDFGGGLGNYPAGSVFDFGKIDQALGVSFKGWAEDPIDRWNYNSDTFFVDKKSTRENTLKNSGRYVVERIYAAYMSGKVEIGKLTVLGGARFERTENTRTQPVVNNSLSSVDPNDYGFDFDRDLIAGTLAQYNGTGGGRGTYNRVNPSIHLVYRFNKNTKLALEYGRTLGRPNWGNLMGSVEYSNSSRKVKVPNMDLKPRTSENWDLSFEYYFGRQKTSAITLAVFQKDLKNYEVDADIMISPYEALALGANPEAGDFEGSDDYPDYNWIPWTLETKLNGGSGRVRGFEASYTQAFPFLPGALSGLSVDASFTCLTAEGTFTFKPGEYKTQKIQGFIPRSAAAGVNWNYHRFQMRLAWSWNDTYQENTPDKFEDTKFRYGRWVLDFTGKIKLTRNVTFFVDLSNLSSNHGAKYKPVSSGRLMRVETNALDFLGTAGIQATF